MCTALYLPGAYFRISNTRGRFISRNVKTQLAFKNIAETWQREMLHRFEPHFSSRGSSGWSPREEEKLFSGVKKINNIEIF